MTYYITTFIASYTAGAWKSSIKNTIKIYIRDDLVMKPLILLSTVSHYISEELHFLVALLLSEFNNFTCYIHYLVY